MKKTDSANDRKELLYMVALLAFYLIAEPAIDALMSLFI